MADPIPTERDDLRAPGVRTPSDTELLSTLFELGREVTSVLDLEELLAKIPQLIARLTRFSAFSVYLLDEKRKELRIAYAVGYPGNTSPNMRLKLGEGVVGAAVEEGRPILVNDIRKEPRYRGRCATCCRSSRCRCGGKGKVIGALNLLNEDEGAFTSQDEALLRQFGAHVAVAIENATLFESERRHNDTLEALAEISREMSSILDLDALLTRIANLTKRLIDYRTFGILLLNEATQVLEMKLAVRYGKDATATHVKLGEGMVGLAAQNKEPVLVADVSAIRATQPRRGCAVRARRADAHQRSLHGVFDLESPELEAFTKEHKELMILLASQAAVAIENARLYEQVRRNEERIEKELRFAQRVQAALLPLELPTPIPTPDVAVRFAPARELGGDIHDFLSPESNTLVVAVGDVSGKGVPAALYGAFAAELVRSRTMRRRFVPNQFSVSGVLQVMNTILHERQLEEYTARSAIPSSISRIGRSHCPNSGLPYPVRCSANECGQIELPGVPLGSFAGVTYDEKSHPLHATTCSSSVRTASSRRSTKGGRVRSFRLCEIVSLRQKTAREIVDAIFDAVIDFPARSRRTTT